jgi:hypothetical protein
MKLLATQLGAAESKRSFTWIDLLVLIGLFGLLWSILHFGSGMVVHFDESQSLKISTSIRHIPYYAGRTLLRMWIAFGWSLIFTFAVGYAAAKSRIARAIILPVLDICQSVPVLGFLSVTVTGFMALFPGSLLGVEFDFRLLSFARHDSERHARGGHEFSALPPPTVRNSGSSRIGSQPDLELHDVIWRWLVFRGFQRGHYSFK